VFESHEFAGKAWERYRLVRTKSPCPACVARCCHRLWCAGRREAPNEAEFRAALEHVVGPQKHIESIAIGRDDDIEQRRQDVISAVTKVDDGSGVVVLTDMFGGTPSNLAISVMNGSAVEVIAGVNLSMLIKLATVRETSSLEQAVIQAQEAARKYIYVASQVLGAKPHRIEHVRQYELRHVAE
jgi:mannose PTS system EIIA component